MLIFRIRGFLKRTERHKLAFTTISFQTVFNKVRGTLEKNFKERIAE
jgi:hypothetical protein